MRIKKNKKLSILLKKMINKIRKNKEIILNRVRRMKLKKNLKVRKVVKILQRMIH